MSYSKENRVNNNTTMQAVYNVTKLLDGLLSNYDSSLRPDFGGQKATIFGNTSLVARGHSLIACKIKNVHQGAPNVYWAL